MTKKTMTNLIQKYIEAYNSFDIDGMIQLLHPDIIFRNYTNGQVDVETKGIDEFKQVADQSTKIFTSRTQRIKEITFPNEVAEVLIDYTGVLAMDLPNGLKAGETMHLEGKSIFQFNKEKISKIEDHS